MKNRTWAESPNSVAVLYRFESAADELMRLLLVYCIDSEGSVDWLPLEVP